MGNKDTDSTELKHHLSTEERKCQERDCETDSTSQDDHEKSVFPHALIDTKPKNTESSQNTSQKEKLENGGQERRDFLTSSLGLVGACGAAALAVPFIDQLRPSARQAEASTVQLDISGIKQGEEQTIRWRGQPVVIRNRTPEEIEEARLTPLASLEDQLARNANLPAQDAANDLARSAGQGHENWLVFINICTHLGCPTQKIANGWFCPCHGSRYDMAARVTKGPANKNMAIPPYRFVSDTVIEIG